MEQEQSSADYVWPLVINVLLIFNIVGAIASSNAHARDGYLGGLEYIFYAGLSILISAGINISAFAVAYQKRSTAAQVIYGVAALVFSAGSALVIYIIAHMGNLKPGG